MLSDSRAFSGFSVGDIAEAKRFYGETLGIEVEEADGMLHLHPKGVDQILVYPKPDHVPAAYTVLNFVVDDIESAVRDLGSRGVEFARYDGFGQDELGIQRDERMDMAIAWFTDPAGNVISLIQ